MRFLALLGLVFWTYPSYAQEAHAGKDSVLMTETTPVDFILDGSASTSTDSIVNYYWVYHGDTIGNAPTLEVSLSENRNRLTLIIEDQAGNTDADGVDIFLGHPTNYGMNRLPLRDSSHYRFVAGMNIAWMHFANDLNTFTPEDRSYFEEVLGAISASGGNAVRWWLHTNGANSPIINENGFVEGIEFESIQAMKQVLDMAYDHGIVISMCLWSFDMLQNQGQDRQAVKALLQDSTNIQSYIDNALIPILQLVGEHPAVMTWEIFNEPEGMTSQFGWTPDRIQMSDVQRFVNRCAGAIHRNTSRALVSNGAWNIQVNTDVDNFRNYYSKENLVAQGGDPDGYLDFYQIHYYPNHFSNDKSPFHRPASYWGLDGPIVIGEFPADTIAGRANPGFSVAKAYELAVDYGYAGAMSWSWSDTNFNRDFKVTARGLDRVASMIPGDLEIPSDMDIDRIPQLVREMAPFRTLVEEISGNQQLMDLQDYFHDEEDGNDLRYTIAEVNGPTGATPIIQNGSEVVLQFSEPVPGLTQVKFRGMDTMGWYVDAEAVIMLGTIEGNAQNLAYFKPVSSSSQAHRKFDIYVNDGDMLTEWESTNQDFDTLILDLGANLGQNLIAIHWDAVAIDKYQLQISADSLQWQTLFDETYSLEDQVAFALGEGFQARYLRLNMANESENSTFRVSEITSELIVDNQPPEVVQKVEDITQTLSTVENQHNYVRFEDVFDDQEHPEYLSFDFENSNDDLVKPERSIGNDGLSLIFVEGQIGTSEITVTATDPFGASSSISFRATVLEDPLSLQEEDTSISLYPNPASEVLHMDVGSEFSGPYHVQVLNSSGQSVNQWEADGSAISLDVSHYPSGQYIIWLFSLKNQSFKRFIKQ